MSIFSFFELSDLNSTFIITPSPTNYFVYKSALLWNLVNNIVLGKRNDFSINISLFKLTLKKYLLLRQSAHDPKEWISKNYDIHEHND